MGLVVGKYTRSHTDRTADISDRLPVVIIGGILAALAGRMKEIEGGEEDEASKY